MPAGEGRELTQHGLVQRPRNGEEVRLAAIEYRADPDSPKFEGYAALFNTQTEIFKDFFEVVAPGAFARALKEKQDVRALVDHDPSKILGRTTAGTLQLREDKTGLRSTILPPNTQLGRDTKTSLERGDISQMSFAFRVVKQEWEDKGEITVRTLLDVDLFDVSIVTYPAYPDTTVAVRCRDSWLSNRRLAGIEERKKWQEWLDAEKARL